MRMLVFCVALLGCKQPDPPAISAPWTDAFDRVSLGSDYLPTSDPYHITGGRLSVSKAYNHPLWLRKKLPAHATIELDCMSQSAAGDIKVEAWGDGESYAQTKGAYTSTGYVFIQGGWHNSKSEIAREDEHLPDLPSRTEPRVEVGRTYHWKIVRHKDRVDWYVDDMSTPFLTLPDPQPLVGKGHEYFGFNNWESDLWFDNLTITPLP
jgi:hypothetical protein